MCTTFGGHEHCLRCCPKKTYSTSFPALTEANLRKQNAPARHRCSRNPSQHNLRPTNGAVLVRNIDSECQQLVKSVRPNTVATSIVKEEPLPGSLKTVAAVQSVRPQDIAFSELFASHNLASEFHPCHRNTNTPNGGHPHPAVLGSQTATFGTSGTR
jgi:hypothetical protein